MLKSLKFSRNVANSTVSYNNSIGDWQIPLSIDINRCLAPKILIGASMKNSQMNESRNNMKWKQDHMSLLLVLKAALLLNG